MTKKSKMLIALLLAMVMILATACSSSDEVKQPASVNGDSSVTSNEEPTGNDSDNEQENDTAEITVAETILYEADGVKVTATGYEDGWMGPEIKILVENDSSENICQGREYPHSQLFIGQWYEEVSDKPIPPQ